MYTVLSHHICCPKTLEGQSNTGKWEVGGKETNVYLKAVELDSDTEMTQVEVPAVTKNIPPCPHSALAKSSYTVELTCMLVSLITALLTPPIP